jgi:hypothetical protein
VHNIRDQQRWHRSLSALPEVAGHLKDMLKRFLTVVRCVDATTLHNGALESLPLPSQAGRSRTAGIDVNRPRMVAAMQAVIALSSRPGGLSSRDLAAKVRELTGQSEAEYGPRQASYDLKKLRAKAFVQRVAKSRRYEATEPGLRTWPLWGFCASRCSNPSWPRRVTPSLILRFLRKNAAHSKTIIWPSTKKFAACCKHSESLRRNTDNKLSVRNSEGANSSVGKSS